MNGDDYPYWLEIPPDRNAECNGLRDALPEAIAHISRPRCSCGKDAIIIYADPEDREPWKVSCACGRFTRGIALAKTLQQFATGPWLIWKGEAEVRV